MFVSCMSCTFQMYEEGCLNNSLFVLFWQQKDAAYSDEDLGTRHEYMVFILYFTGILGLQYPGSSVNYLFEYCWYYRLIVTTSTLPPTVQKWSENILDWDAAVFHWWRPSNQSLHSCDQRMKPLHWGLTNFISSDRFLVFTVSNRQLKTGFGKLALHPVLSFSSSPQMHPTQRSIMTWTLFLKTTFWFN